MGHASVHRVTFSFFTKSVVFGEVWKKYPSSEQPQKILIFGFASTVARVLGVFTMLFVVYRVFASVSVISFSFYLTPSRGFTPSDVLDKPWPQVSFPLLPPWYET